MGVETMVRGWMVAALVVTALGHKAGMAAQQPSGFVDRRPLPPPIREARQLVVVKTSGWDAVDGTLQRYERDRASGRWKKEGPAVAIVMGKSGMGWGLGVAPWASSGVGRGHLVEPVKHEGDGRSPAGVFALGPAFGYAASALPGWKMPYLPLTPSIECVDDADSKFYNQTLDRGTVAVDWKSSEQMRRSDEYYRWGVIVQHNAATTDSAARPGSGSCIFLHIWGGKGQGTAGCTAMAQPLLERLIGWLDPALHPLLVQLPRQPYKRLKNRWQLP